MGNREQQTKSRLIPKEELIVAYQNIDASLTAADLQAIKDAFGAVLQNFPFSST